MKPWRVRRGLGVLIGLLLGGGLISGAEAADLVTAAPGYTVERFATGLQNPVALALSAQGPFGAGLYVATGPAVLRVGADGQTGVVIEGLITPEVRLPRSLLP